MTTTRIIPIALTMAAIALTTTGAAQEAAPRFFSVLVGPGIAPAHSGDGHLVVTFEEQTVTQPIRLEKGQPVKALASLDVLRPEGNFTVSLRDADGGLLLGADGTADAQKVVFRQRAPGSATFEPNLPVLRATFDTLNGQVALNLTCPDANGLTASISVHVADNEEKHVVDLDGGQQTIVATFEGLPSDAQLSAYARDARGNVLAFVEGRVDLTSQETGLREANMVIPEGSPCTRLEAGVMPTAHPNYEELDGQDFVTSGRFSNPESPRNTTVVIVEKRSQQPLPDSNVDTPASPTEGANITPQANAPVEVAGAEPAEPIASRVLGWLYTYALPAAVLGAIAVGLWVWSRR